MKIKEITIKKDADLKQKLAELKTQLTKQRFEIATKESQKSNEIGKIKKTIARIQTILRERELQREEESNEKKA
jgi:large subunit ribosomal protein L29